MIIVIINIIISSNNNVPSEVQMTHEDVADRDLHATQPLTSWKTSLTVLRIHTYTTSV